MSDTDHENPHGDIRFRYLQIGVVVARNDPMGLSRVRVRIPGLINDQSAWAFPLGAPGGGGPGVGLKMTPRLGAEVGILFKNGDPDAPWYLPAHWGAPGGASEMPSAVANIPASEQPEDVDCLETEVYQIIIDNRPGKERLALVHKPSGDLIEHDGTKATGPGWTISGSAALLLKSVGQVVVDSISALINGRKVSDGSQSI